MKKFHVNVAVRILGIYEINAEDPANASELWGDGKLIHWQTRMRHRNTAKGRHSRNMPT